MESANTENQTAAGDEYAELQRIKVWC